MPYNVFMRFFATDTTLRVSGVYMYYAWGLSMTMLINWEVWLLLVCCR